MGRGIVEGVAEKLVGEMAACLAARISLDSTSLGRAEASADGRRGCAGPGRRSRSRSSRSCAARAGAELAALLHRGGRPHVTLPRFELHRPETIDEALDLLDALGDDAIAMHGGTELLLLLKLGLAEYGHIVDLKRIPELRGVTAGTACCDSARARRISRSSARQR